MNSIFEAYPAPVRAGFHHHYLTYLRQRNGLPDLATRTFPCREALFRELMTNPIRRTGQPAVDQQRFTENYLRRRPAVGLDERLLWALCMGKGNRSERHGIDYKLKKKGYSPGGAENPFVYIEIEETYHSRILADALQTIGIKLEFTPPYGLTRWLIELLGVAPHPLADVFVLDAEVVGVILFKLLREKALQLFGDQPVPLSRIEGLLRQILVDEVGHVHFLRSRLGPVRLAIARSLLPLVARALLDDLPEFGLLFGRDELMAEALRADVDGAAASFAERLPPWPV